MLQLEKQQTDAEPGRSARNRVLCIAKKLRLQVMKRSVAKLKSRITTEEAISIAEANKRRQIEIAEKNRERAVAIETEKVEKARQLEVVTCEREVELQAIDKEKSIGNRTQGDCQYHK